MTEREAEIERAAMELLEEALERPSNDQIPYVESRIDVPEAVRRQALALLRSDREEPAPIQTGGASHSLTQEDTPPPGIAGYRILRQLGRGGMGAVWLAERDGADFEHRVAIKVIKPGVLLEALVDRFRRERQILAQLNHPHIARLYDGGETAEGQPYIVMEYVEGRTLRDWLAEEQPSLRRRLLMFRQIGEAVEFAHQNLVIHRDLTPNNVLVTGSEQAKLIDFGIARPHVADAEQATTSTISGLSLTPGFAAPERKWGAASNTLTDVFSLGRILALMLEGSSEPELDAIARRASAEAPAERYPSVGELLDDVGRFERHEPVTVFSNARGYRFGKFVRRERRLVAATSAILLALVGGLAGTAWAYDRAERERQTAEHRFEQLRDLARFQLFDLYDEMDSVVGNTAARVALAQRAQDYLVTLAESRSDDPELQLDTADGFLRLARIQGIPGHPNFGEPDLAAENLERAERLYAPLAEAGIGRARTGLALLEAYRTLLLAHGESKPAEAREALSRAEAYLTGVPEAARDEDWMQARRAVRIAALEWGDLQLDVDFIRENVALLEADIADWPRSLRGGYEESTDQARALYYRAIIEHNLATEESLPRSLSLYLQADRKFAEIEDEHPNDPMTLYWRAWNAYYGYAVSASLEDEVVTARLLQQARSSVERLLTIEEADNSLITFDERLREAQAQLFANTGRGREAIALMQQVIDGREAKMKRDRASNNISDLAFGLAIFGTIYRQAGDRAGACASWTRSEALMAELEAADALQGFVAKLRPGMKRNIARCRAGAPVSEFTVLAET